MRKILKIIGVWAAVLMILMAVAPACTADPPEEEDASGEQTNNPNCTEPWPEDDDEPGEEKDEQPEQSDNTTEILVWEYLEEGEEDDDPKAPGQKDPPLYWPFNRLQELWRLITGDVEYVLVGAVEG